MKRSIIILFTVLTVVFYSCKDDDKTVSVVGVTINTPSTVTLKTGDNLPLSAVVTPDNASRKDLLWVSNRPDIAIVNSETGFVTAVFHGEVKITVTSKEGYKTDAVTLTVSPAVYTTGIDITGSDKTIAAKDTMYLDYEVYPSNATDNRVVWTSSNPAVATVAVINGKVTLAGIAHGMATITATTREGAHTATKNVLVKPVTNIVLTGVTLPAVVNLEEGNEVTLSPVFMPAAPTIKERSWESNQPDVVEVAENGKITALSIGTANITFTAVDYDGNTVSATCEVNVGVFVTNITLNVNWATIKVGETVTLAARIEPDNATNKDLTWKSENPLRATVAVDQDGVVTVTGISTGNAIITATSEISGASVSCDIIVTE